MSQLVVLACCLLGLAAAAPPAPYDLAQADKYFQDFMSTHHKQYSSESEKMARFEIFKQNLETINELNKKDGGAVFGVTKFTDLTFEEFRPALEIIRSAGSCNASSPDHNRTGPVPDEFDWRTENKVTDVRDDLFCESDWAFSVVYNVESQYAIVHNEFKVLSPYQIVDCDDSGSGCYGGLNSNAMLYVQNAGGIMSEADYPFEVEQKDCKFNKTKVEVKVAGCHQYTFESEDELKETLYRVGPLSISLYGCSFRDYTGGIMKFCVAAGRPSNFLLVGYGTENKTPYWLIKTAFGDTWAENGYARIERNVNICGILDKEHAIITAVVE